MAEQTEINEDQSFQSFVEEVQYEFEQTQKQLKEIDVLIKQSAAEVERLAQRNSQVTTYVRQLQIFARGTRRNKMRSSAFLRCAAS